MVCVMVGWFGLVACGDDNHPGKPTPVLQTLAISPASASVAIGDSVQLTANGTFSDGKTIDITTMVTWSSSSDATATVSATGVVAGVAFGNATITASLDGITASAAIDVPTVAEKILTAITVTPVDPTIAPNANVQLAATATFSDQSTADITASVTWASDNGSVATVDANGLVTATATPGTAKITAALLGVSGSTTVTVVLGAPTLVSIAVTPASSTLHVGATQQMTATGTLSDTTTQDLTATAAWTSSDNAIATVDATGLVTAKAAGTATITATSGAISGAASVSVDVPLPILLSITLGPVPASAPAGLTQQLVATGHFDVGPDVDLTNSATWTSDAPANASVDATGLVTGHLKATTANITATSGTISGSLQFSVIAPVFVGLVVTPGTATLRGTEVQQFLARLAFSDGSTNPTVPGETTWSSSKPAVASIPQFGGLAKAIAAGTASITAQFNGMSASATLTVQAPSVLATTPADGSLGVRATSHIKIAFDQAIAPLSLTTQTDPGPCTGSIQVSSDDFATCIGFAAANPAMNAGSTAADATPSGLVAGTLYKIRVTADATTPAGDATVQAFTQTTGFAVADAGCASGLVISQVFGGGGRVATSPFFSDFIELHNGGRTDVHLKDWSIQFATAAGVTWSLQNLPDVVVAPGGYFLIQEGSDGAVGGADLPTPDFSPTNVFQLAQNNAKVALVQGHTLLTGACPVADSADFLGYGTASCFEGTAAAAGTNLIGPLRGGNGCVDTEDNKADFASVKPTPRNSATAPFACTCSTH
jgi:uncharacterized protein YjdB